MAKQSKSLGLSKKVGQSIARPFKAALRRSRNLLKRRPHRSFRLTRRRDYARSLKLPGYWAFTATVFKAIWAGRKQLLLLSFIYVIASIALVGLASQSAYSQLSEYISETGEGLFEGNWGQVSQASLLLVGTLTAADSPAPEAQAYGGIAILFYWLAAVWLLRQQLAGRQPRLRDALYNSGAPVLATCLVGLVAVVQLIPLALALIAYAAASSAGILTGGVESMLVWLGLIGLATVSAYWLVSTILALVVITLPGMYPMQAIRTAGDLAVGRRLRIVLRLVWQIPGLAIAWLVVMVPLILLDSW